MGFRRGGVGDTNERRASTPWLSWDPGKIFSLPLFGSTDLVHSLLIRMIRTANFFFVWRPSCWVVLGQRYHRQSGNTVHDVKDLIYPLRFATLLQTYS